MSIQGVPALAELAPIRRLISTRARHLQGHDRHSTRLDGTSTRRARGRARRGGGLTGASRTGPRIRPRVLGNFLYEFRPDNCPLYSRGLSNRLGWRRAQTQSGSALPSLPPAGDRRRCAGHQCEVTAMTTATWIDDRFVDDGGARLRDRRRCRPERSALKARVKSRNGRVPRSAHASPM
jgi:hypothetical protein